jgi:hypothetical protein
VLDYDIQPGDQMFLQCKSGPCTSRLERFPPPLEIEEREGTYILEDDGPIEECRYLFVPRPL